MQADEPNQIFVFEEEDDHNQIEEIHHTEDQTEMTNQKENHSDLLVKADQSLNQQGSYEEPRVVVLTLQQKQQDCIQPKNGVNLVFSEQNAYSFRQPTFPKTINNSQLCENKPKEVQKAPNLQFPIPKQEGDDFSKENFSHLKRNHHSKSNASDISNSDIVSENNKLTDLHDANRIVPSMFVQLSQEENHKTQDPLQSEKVSPLNLIKERKASRINRRKLPPLQEAKNGKIIVNSSSVQLMGNQNSIVELEPNSQQINGVDNPLQANHTKDMAIAMARVSSHRTTNYNFIRERTCCSYPVYSLALKDMSLIVNAKKEFGHLNSYYNITCEEKVFESSNSYLGYLKGNFAGTEFNLFQTCSGKDELTCTICYKAELTCNSAFRTIEIFIKSQDAPYDALQGADEGLNLQDLYEIGQNGSLGKIVKLINKKPEWSQSNNCYLLNLKGRSRMGSVKNMALIEEGQSAYSMLFCKTAIDHYHLELTHPLSPFIGLGILLSSFDFKLFCQ